MSNERNKHRLLGPVVFDLQPPGGKNNHKKVQVRRVVLCLPGLSRSGNALLFLHKRKDQTGGTPSHPLFELTITW